MELCKFRSCIDITELGTWQSHFQLPLAKYCCWAAAGGPATELGIINALWPHVEEERTNSMEDPSINPAGKKVQVSVCFFLPHHLTHGVWTCHSEIQDHLSRAHFCDLFSIQKNVLFFTSWQILGWELRRESRAVYRGWQSSLLSLDLQEYYKGFIGVILPHSKHLVLCYNQENEGNSKEITYESTQGVSFESKGKTYISMRRIPCFGLKFKKTFSEEIEASIEFPSFHIF